VKSKKIYGGILPVSKDIRFGRKQQSKKADLVTNIFLITSLIPSLTIFISTNNVMQRPVNIRSQFSIIAVMSKENGVLYKIFNTEEHDICVVINADITREKHRVENSAMEA